MKRILRLDGVRALAFLTIFVHHGFGIPHLWAGVDIFFVLSGFLITSILIDGRGKEGAWGRFYERRAHLLRAFGLFDHVNSHRWSGKGRGMGSILRKARPPHSSPLCCFLRSEERRVGKECRSRWPP